MQTETTITPANLFSIPAHERRTFARQFPRSFNRMHRLAKSIVPPAIVEAESKIEINITSEDLIAKFIDSKPHKVLIEKCGPLTAVSWHEVVSKSRDRKTVMVRQIVFYLMQKYSGWSSPRIGRLVGGRDHATVLHGVSEVKHWLSLATAQQETSPKNYGPDLGVLETALRNSNDAVQP